MTKKLVVIMSHQLTNEQVQDAKSSLKVKKVEQLNTPSTQQARTLPAEWDFDQVKKLAFDIVIDAVKANATHVSVMGEPALVTACYLEAKTFKMVFCQSTTERISQDIPQPDGTVKKIAVFRHVQWRVWQ